MIAKVIAVGRDRDEALARLGRALGETVVVIEGGGTNKAFLLELLARPEVRAGDVSTGWLDRLTAEPAGPREHAAVALVAAAIALSRRQEALDEAAFFAMAARGRPQTREGVGHRVEFRVGGTAYRADVAQTGPTRYRVVIDGERIIAELMAIGPYLDRVSIGDRAHRVLTVVDGADILVEVDDVAHRVRRDEGGLVRSPAPGLVVAVPVQPGEEVDAGATVAVIEAMKMETAVTTPVAGRVTEVLVGANVQVAAGAPLVRVDAADAAATGDPGGTIDLAPLVTATEERRRPPAVEGLRAVLLGYEFEPTVVRWLLDRLPRGDGRQAARRPEARARAARTVRRPVRALAQPAGRRDGERRDRPQRARAPAHLPRIARHGERTGPADVRTEAAQGARPLRRRQPRALAPADVGAAPAVPRARAGRDARPRRRGRARPPRRRRADRGRAPSARPPHRRDAAALPPARRAGSHHPVHDVRRAGAGAAPGRRLRARDVAARAARRPSARARPGGGDERARHLPVPPDGAAAGPHGGAGRPDRAAGRGDRPALLHHPRPDRRLRPAGVRRRGRHGPPGPAAGRRLGRRRRGRGRWRARAGAGPARRDGRRAGHRRRGVRRRRRGDRRARRPRRSGPSRAGVPAQRRDPAPRVHVRRPHRWLLDDAVVRARSRRARRVAGGSAGARDAPDARRAPAAVAALGVRPGTAAVGSRGGAPPLHGPGEPDRPAPRRARRGAGLHGGPRPHRRRRRPSRAGARALAGRGRAARRAGRHQRLARLEPHRPVHLARRRRADHRSRRRRSPTGADDARRSGWSRCWCTAGWSRTATRPRSSCASPTSPAPASRST